MNFPNNLNTCGFTVKPNRFEVIDHRLVGNGCAYVKSDCHVHLQSSDDGTCLSIVLKGSKSDNVLTHNFAACSSVNPETIVIEDCDIVQTFWNDVEIKMGVENGGLTLKLYLYDR